MAVQSAGRMGFLLIYNVNGFDERETRPRRREDGGDGEQSF